MIDIVQCCAFINYIIEEIMCKLNNAKQEFKILVFRRSMLVLAIFILVNRSKNTMMDTLPNKILR